MKNVALIELIRENFNHQNFNYNFQIKLSKTCYNDEVQTVGVAGLSNEIVSNFWSHKPQAVILIDNASRASTIPGPGTRKTRYKLQNFIITASSIPRLKRNLQHLRTLPWWNHMASFLIVDESTLHDQDCSNALKILTTAWKMNLLRAKFICHCDFKGPLIFSYNPYTNQAPLPWQMAKTSRIKNNHPWSLLVRGYQDSQEICENLDFDKTKDLGGYEIRLSSFSVNDDKNWSKTNLESISSPNGILLHYIFRTLNSTVRIFVESPKSISELTSSGFADISLDALPQQNNYNTSMTYPCGSSKLVSMTQHRGHLSEIGKLLRVLDISSRYAVFTVFFVTFVFFKLILRQSVTSAILNIVRLICNTAVPNLSNHVAMRMYLGGLFIFLLTLQGIYQGQLASLLTKQVSLPNVDSLEDLENWNYTIYNHKDITQYLKVLNFSGRVVSLEDFACEKYVLEDAGAACVHEWSLLVNIAKSSDLHLSRNQLIRMFLVYLIREDWPVEEKLNTVISRLVEADIFHRVSRKKIDSTIRRIKYDEEKKDKQEVKVMTLNELAFTFAILGIGLGCATVIFIVEILMQKK